MGAGSARGEAIMSNRGTAFFHVSGPNRVQTSAWRPPVHQQRVDEILAAARTDRSHGRSTAQDLPRNSLDEVRLTKDATDLQLAEELRMLRTGLDALGERFASDPDLLQHYGDELQTFDRMSQVLGHLAQVVAAENKEPAIECIGMQELRLRLKRTLVKII
jgi:hypothetical protein